MRLEDFGIILLMLAACAVALFGGMALVSLWPQIRQFVRALWRRYVTFSWDDLLWRVADEDVKAFGGESDDRGSDLSASFQSRLSHMSSTRPVPSAPVPVPPGTGSGTGRDLAALARDLTEDQWVELLLRRQKPDGSWWASGKKLFPLIGGNYKAFLDRAATIRGDDRAEADAEEEIVTPWAGRRTLKSYYPDEPDLEYSPP